MAKDGEALDPLRAAILGLLSIKPMSGYDVIRSYRRALERIWQAPAGQIYPTLRAMAKQGLLDVSVEIQDARPNRKVYRLSDAGMSQFRAWLERPAGAPVMHHEFLHKLFLMDQLPVELRQPMIENYVRSCRSWVAHMKLVETKLRGSLDGPHGGSVYFQLLAIGHLRNVMEAEIRSAERVARRYAKGPEPRARIRPSDGGDPQADNPFGDLYLFPEDLDEGEPQA